ncbi:MAG: FHA domain-containing protein [Planctomycetota bacterium]|nr:FHA domain-containing protein [Planctomycetota bacterium]
MASIIVIFAGQEQKTYPLDKPSLTVGREPGCEIHIDNLGISRRHCEFIARGDAYVLKDLGSSNGTYVNGHKITEHFLNDADEVIIGKYTLKFKNEKQVTAAPQPAGAEAGPAVPDTLNTYVMDGNKIQEQLAKMRAAQGGGGVPATAKDYAKALDPGQSSAATAGEVGKLKTLLVALLAVVVVLLVVIILMFAGIIKAGA